MCPPFELTFSPQTTIARGLLYVYVSEEIIHIFISIYHIFNINPKIRDSSFAWDFPRTRTVPDSSYIIPASVSTMRTANDAPMATTIRLFLANASMSAVANPITADSSMSVAVSIAGNVIAASVANGT